jgi:RNA polymerase sigma-70 factor (ECF subfamily)
MKSKLSDKELIGQFVSGHTKAFEILIARHKDKVYSYILYNVKNQELAEDIFQDTFIKVINSLKKGVYFEQGVFASWVIRIAHNLIIDHFRKENRMPTYSNDSLPELNLFNSKNFSDETVEDLIVREQIERDVRNLIDELPDEQKEVVLLRIFGNLSFKEIADQTNVSINTALGRMRYALMNLRKLVDEKNIILTLN